MRTYRPKTWIALLTLAAFSLLNYSFAQPAFESASERQAERRPTSEYLTLPSAGTLEALFVGFETMAADAAWILSLVHYGPRTNRDPVPKHLLENARTVTELDPRFYDVYEWASGAFVYLRREIRIEEIERLNEFLERGMEHFPHEYYLPYDAGMNYVGYPTYRNSRERLEGHDRAARYLQRAATLEGAPDHLPLTISWLHEKRRKLRNELEGEEAQPSGATERDYFDFLSKVYYLVDKESVRHRIEAELERTPAGRRALAALETKYSQTLKHQHPKSFSYLPLDLWALVAAPTKGAESGRSNVP